MQPKGMYGEIFVCMVGLTYIGYLQPPKGFQSPDGDVSYFYRSWPVFVFFFFNSTCFYLGMCGIILYTEMVILADDVRFQQEQQCALFEKAMAILSRLCILTFLLSFAFAGIASSAACSLPFFWAMSLTGSAFCATFAFCLIFVRFAPIVPAIADKIRAFLGRCPSQPLLA
ncbi:hypothetical protein KP509_09G035700 [Ceratopteris richardii]|uniref:PGG domain-containing protein n=1 Tax=Ceratopteris richardii TaxID=49495 RepID=A0A8T2U3T5_CERRI|nr:hypothetical protein KP509_09G035700 [Ceratopteris richardii]